MITELSFLQQNAASFKAIEEAKKSDLIGEIWVKWLTTKAIKKGEEALRYYSKPANALVKYLLGGAEVRLSEKVVKIIESGDRN